MKFILPAVLIASALLSCSSKSKLTGIVTYNAPIFASEAVNDTVQILPAGTVLEFISMGSTRAKVISDGHDSYIDKRFFVANAKPGVMKKYVDYPDGTHFRDNGFVVCDSIENDQAHIYYGETSNNAWVDAADVDLDTANAAVAALVDALDNKLADDNTRATLMRIAASHSAHPLVQIINIDLSEAPDAEIRNIQKKYNLLLNKSKKQVVASKETATVWVNDYMAGIFALPSDGQEVDEYSHPRLKYFYSYVCALPAFVKVTPKSMATSWAAPKESDPVKSYLLYRMDRSPENIKRLYDVFKPLITDQLTAGFLQDIRPDVTALITAYDRIIAIPNHRAVLSDISKKIQQWDKKNTDENGINNSMYTMVEQASIYEPIVDLEKYDPRMDGKGIWYSSFWTRRFAEGNEKVVYDILKELTELAPQQAAYDRNEDESNETELITCVFKDYGVGDCGHVIFSCGDYGDADTSGLSEEEQKLWNDLGVDDETNGPSANPKYVGKSFSIRIGTTTGPACNDGQGGEGTIPRILQFKLVN